MTPEQIKKGGWIDFRKLEVTPEILDELVIYDPETGELFWKPRPIHYFNDGDHSAGHNCAQWNSRWEGKKAFNTLHSEGYLNGSLFYKFLFTHRVAWALAFGKWPENQIDHINRGRTDNRLANLRDVEPSINRRNVGLASNNTSGYSGVSFSKRDKVWKAQIKVRRKTISLGSFSKKIDAIAARKSAEEKFGFLPHPNQRKAR